MKDPIKAAGRSLLPLPYPKIRVKFRFIELLIFEFVRRGDLWSPAKCFDFVGKLVIIP